jgi:hypothetical protein
MAKGFSRSTQRFRSVLDDSAFRRPFFRFSRRTARQRDDDASLTAAAFEFDTIRDQTRQQAAAMTAKRFYFFLRIRTCHSDQALW